MRMRVLALVCALLAFASATRGQTPPAAQKAYLKASNTDSGDFFGGAVSLSGDTLAVGARSEESASTGVNGDESDDSADFAGAVYIFVRSEGTWVQQAYVKASNTGVGDGFGTSLSLSGDTLVVGAPGESSSATGVDGDQGDDGASVSGAAYVFVRNGTRWSQQAYLKASNTDAVDRFGSSVAVSGDVIVVGAEWESSAATGVNGAQGDDSADQAGAAYVFVRNGTSWSQQAYLKASNTGAGDYFGTAVAVSGHTVVVGAPSEDSGSTGVNGWQFGELHPFAGAAYVFDYDGIQWRQQAYLKASNTGFGDKFGSSVSLDGDTVVVGAPGESSSATGVDGDQFNDGAHFAGAAYVFAREGGMWSQQAYLKSWNTDAEDRFGSAVSVSDEGLIVGALREDSNAVGVGGDASNNGATDSGAAYVFTRGATLWSLQSYVKASNTGAGDQFGGSVSIFGETWVAGASSEDSGAVGVGGNQADNSASAAGATYVFELDTWINLGFQLSGTTGWPWLVATGPLTPGSANQLTLISGLPSAAAVLVVGLTPLYAPVKGGTLVPSPHVMLFLATNPSGQLFLPFTWPVGVPASTALFVQIWVTDSGGPKGLAASNGLKGLSN